MVAEEMHSQHTVRSLWQTNRKNYLHTQVVKNQSSRCGFTSACHQPSCFPHRNTPRLIWRSILRQVWCEVLLCHANGVVHSTDCKAPSDKLCFVILEFIYKHTAYIHFDMTCLLLWLTSLLISSVELPLCISTLSSLLATCRSADVLSVTWLSADWGKSKVRSAY